MPWINSNNNIGLSITGSINGGGIRHFTNWDKELTSIKLNNKENFEKRSATNFLQDYVFFGGLNQDKQVDFGAADIKIVDNIAAISYPEFTDIHKIVHTITPEAGDYIPLYGKLTTGASEPLAAEHFIIPIFDFNIIDEFGIDNLDLDGLYISITYQGDISSDIDTWQTVPGLAGKKQILRWAPSNFGIPPGYFSIQKISKANNFTMSGCGAPCGTESIYVIVANLGTGITPSIFNSDRYFCGTEVSVTPVPPTPEPPPPDLFGSLFEPFDFDNSDWDTGKLFGSDTCYMCMPGPYCIGQPNAFPELTCEEQGLYSNISACEGACGVSGSNVTCKCCSSGNIGATCIEVQYPAGTDCGSVCIPCATVGEQCFTDESNNCDPIIAKSSEIKCSEITLIKYKPIVECGKVDIYNRSQGILTSLSGGIVTSSNHGLNYGDVIKTVGALTNKALNGVFYVGEIVTENTFRIYQDDALSVPLLFSVTENVAWCKIDNNSNINKNKTFNGIALSATSSTLTSAQTWAVNDLVNYQIKIIAGTGKNQVRTISSNTSTQVTVSAIWSITPDATSIFAIYGGESAAWNYYGSIFSPRGKNGYGVVLDYPDEDSLDFLLLTAYKNKAHTWVRESSILSCFNGKSNFDEILTEDYFPSLFNVSYLPDNSKYIWSHYNSISNTIIPFSFNDALLATPSTKYASLMDLFSLFPINYGGVNSVNPNLLRQRPISTYDSYLDNINFKYNGKIRSLPTSDYGVGDIWNSAYNLVNGFKFGCSIDIKKDTVNNKYLLLVGERGLDTVISTADHSELYPYSSINIKQVHPWHTLVPVANTYHQLPQYIHGAAFLFEIAVDANNNINQLTPGYNQSEYSSGISLSDWFTAYKNDSSIAKPRPLTFKYEHYNNQYDLNLSFFNEKDLRSITIDYEGRQASDFSSSDNKFVKLRQKIRDELIKCPGNLYLYNNQEVFNDYYDWYNIEKKTEDAYWYGGMIYGLADINNGASYLTNLRRSPKNYNDDAYSTIFSIIPDYVGGDCDPDGYFSDLIIPKVPTALSTFDLSASTDNKFNIGFYRNSFDLYPYVDSFGKSVALDIVGTDVYIFASSKVKPYIFRPDAGDTEPPGYFGASVFESNTCRSSLLPYCYCGYIHAFKNSQKIQKIFDDSANVRVTPSASWAPQYYKAEKFANCMIAKNATLYWGQAKTIEISNTQVSWDYEKSKIFIYSLAVIPPVSIYYLTNIIINENDRNISYLVNTASGGQGEGDLRVEYGIADYKDQVGNRLIKYKNIVPDFKEFYLRNKLDYFYVESKQASTEETVLTSVDDPYYFYPSDRFGSFFKIDGNILIANAFDDRNELGDQHIQIRWPYTAFSNTKPLDDYYIDFNQPLDYLHVYELTATGWSFVQKISPAFNKEDSRYGYYTNSIPTKIPNSIRSLNNITYANASKDSIVWDIDLTGSFDVVDNRIIIKDPISVSMFEKDPSISSDSSALVPISYKSIPLSKYFTYSEDFEATYLTEEAPCAILFNRINSLYNYDYFLRDNKPVIYKSITQADGDKFLKITTPIYFVNIPSKKFQYYSIQSITIVVEEITSSLTNPLLQLMVYKKDPRTTVYPYYTFDSNFCSPPESDQQIKTKTSPNKFLPYRGGASDLAFYEDGSFEKLSSTEESGYRLCQDNQYQSTCISKSFEPISTTSADGRRINTYTINLNDLNFDFNQYLRKDSLILTQTRNFTVNPNLSESLVINDLENIGYDSSLVVDESLIIGFSFGENLYKFTDLASYNYESDIRISRIDADIKHSSPGAGNYSLRKYLCISSDVSTFDNNPDCFTTPVSKIFNFYDGKNQELPIKTYEEVPSIPVLKNTKSLLGSSSSSLLPSLNDTKSEILSGTFCKSINLFSIDQYGQYGLSYQRSFDIQKVNPFRFYISGNVFVGESKTTTLFIQPPTGSAGSSILYTESGGPIDKSTTLFIKPPLPYAGALPFYTKSSATISSPYLDYPTLYMRCTYFQDNNLVFNMKALQPRSMFLSISGPERFASGLTFLLKGLTSFNNVPLFTDGLDSKTNFTSLLLKADISLSGISFYTAGPLLANSREFTIYDTCNISDTNSLFDISSVAEDAIGSTGRNSIVSNKYGVDEQYSYAVKDVDPKNALSIYNSDGYYNFYFKQRDNLSIASNDNYLCIANNTNIDSAISESIPSDEYPLPTIQIFALNSNKQAELFFTYDKIKNNLEALDIPSDDTYFVANITCLDISPLNRIAATVDVYAYYFDGSGFVKASVILILEPSGNEWVLVNIIYQTTGLNPTKMEETAALTGLYLQWVGEYLYFTQNNLDPSLDQIRVAKSSTGYISEPLNINLTQTDLYTPAFISNTGVAGFVEKIHYGFGHKFIISGDLMFVSCPLVQPYHSLVVATSTSLNSFYGCVFIFKYTTSWTFVSTIYHNGISGLSTAATNSFGRFRCRLFGYDIAYDNSSKNLLVGQPGSNEIYRFKAETTGWSSLWSKYNEENNFGSFIDIFNTDYIALSNKNNGRIYFDNNDNYFEYSSSLTDDEVNEYATSDIINDSEKLINFKAITISGSKYILAIRKFQIDYETGSSTIVQKVSLLNFSRLFRGSLFLKTYNVSTYGAPLYTQGPSFINNGMRLRMLKPYGVDTNSASLFISTRTNFVTPLFMASVEPDQINLGCSLFTYGTAAPNVGIYNKPINLFMKAKDNLLLDSDGISPLFIIAPSKENTVGSAPLFLSYPILTYSSTTTLSIFGNTSGLASQSLTANQSLFIKSLNNGIGGNDTCPLFVYQKEGGVNINLFMNQNGTISNLSFYTQAILGESSNSISLIFQDTKPTQSTTLHVDGFRR